jgi:hypothetical protein
MSWQTDKQGHGVPTACVGSNAASGNRSMPVVKHDHVLFCHASYKVLHPDGQLPNEGIQIEGFIYLTKTYTNLVYSFA